MTDPRIPAGLRGEPPSGPAGGVDPLGWCVIATTALLTWLLGPVVLALFASLGFVRYWRAWRGGRDRSECILGDMRLVLIYLATLAVVGAAATAARFL